MCLYGIKHVAGDKYIKWILRYENADLAIESDVS